MIENTNLTTTQAAERLSSAFGEQTKYWTARLQNERQRSAPNRAPATKVQGRWAYSSVALDAWITEESGRRLARGQLPVTRAGQVLQAFGIGQGGTSNGRKLDCTMTAQVDAESGEHYCQLLVADPLLVFRLERGQVRALAEEMTELADALDRWSTSRPEES